MSDAQVRARDGSAVRRVIRDGEPVWQVNCPDCGKWGDVDDDQLHGRVSLHHLECGFHDYLDFSADPLVMAGDEFDYLRGETRGR
jgi:hypothetical protein